jgi:2-methylcitrate dehydratase
VTGPSPIFEGDMGFFHQVSGEFNLDINSFGGNNSSTQFRLPETYIKYYPAEYHAQSAIWAALEIRKEIDDIGKISSVLIETHEAAHSILGSDDEKWAPKTKETADHSLPYIVAMALTTGIIRNSTYSPVNISNPRTLDMMKKIVVKENRELSAVYPGKIGNRLTVKLTDGKTIARQVDVPKGHPRNPMTQEEVESKFKLLTKRFLTSVQTEKIFDFVLGIERQRDISLLPKLCRVRI